MKQYRIFYRNNESEGNWTGEYSRIEVSENKNDSMLKDIKIFTLVDNAETLTVEILAHRILSIEYDYDEWDEDDVKNSMDTPSFICGVFCGIMFSILLALLFLS